MTTYMHCRPCCGTNISLCSTSFLFFHPNYFTTSNYQTYAPTSYHYHDHTPPPPPPPPPPIVTPGRLRRLEDPITSYATNYYASLPRQISHLSPQQTPSSPPQLSPVPPPPVPPPRRIYQQQSDRNSAYCDLFNLLECPSPTLPPPSIIRQRRKHHAKDISPTRHSRSADSENIRRKIKSVDDRKPHHHHQPPCYLKDKKRQDDKLSSTEQYDQLAQQTKKVNNNYQRRSPNKGFFRRIVRNYLCMPSPFANNGYSS